MLFKRIYSILFCLCLAFLQATEAHAQAKPTPGNSDEAEIAKDASTEINVKNADIAAVVRIFSKKTKRNYILDETVKGKVTIYLPGKVSADEAIRILDSVLALKGFTSVPIGENLWKIVSSKDAKSSTIPTLIDESSNNPSSAVVTRLIHLKFTNAEDIQQLVAQLVSPEGLINAYTGTNSLIIIDSEDNTERLVKIIESIDVPSSNRDMSIVPIIHADAVELADKLNAILGTDDGKGGSGNAANIDLISNRNIQMQPPGLRQPPNGLPGGSPMQANVTSQTVSARSIQPKIIPDERTNSVIIVADEDITARMKALISQLDSEVNLSGTRFYVYRCQHASAEELSDVLSGLVGGGGSSGSSKHSGGGSSFNRTGGDGGDTGLGGFGTAGSTGRNTNSRNRGNRTASTQDRLTSQNRTPGRSRSENGTGSGPGGSFNLGDEVSITADPATNSLIINAGKSDYEKILELLKQLDIKRRQVLVEAMILEVGIDDSTSYGTEFLASTGGADGGVLVKSDFGGIGNLLRDPTKLSNFSVAAASSGTLKLPGGVEIPTQAVLISAAKANSNVNVLSAPNILTTDNEQAEIVVGQNVPFLASQATSDTNLNNTFNQVDRQDVGITLRLTPQISSGDFVTLSIFTEVSNVVERTSGSALGPTTNVRTSETTVIAKDGQMIVIGGLMSDDNQDAESGVPFLSDIPVIGHLFRSTLERSRRTNLLLLITPRVVKDQFDAREATVIKREKMEDAIAREDSYPRHEDVLRSEDIDKTTEATLDTETNPGTITAPKNHKKISPIVTSKELKTDSEGVIELKVAPKLPESNPVEQNGNDEDEGPRASLNLESMPQENEKIVIMQIKSNKKIPENLPFELADDKTNFVVSFPGNSNAYSKGFFQLGEKYSYSTDGEELLFEPAAILTSRKELASYYPELSDKLYTLSPYEIMNVGIAPWAKK
jgi:general secretion pathway protein D